MRFAFHLICWLAMGLSLVAAGLLGLLGAAYITEGHGLHPAAAVSGALIVLWLGWLSAVLADRLEER